MNVYMQQWYIFSMLLKREMYVLARSWKGTVVDAILNAIFFSLLTGYVLPALEISPEVLPPLLVGLLVNVILSVSFTYAIYLAYDFESPRMLQYHLMLPSSIATVLAAYVVGNMIRVLLFFIPLLFGSLLFAGFGGVLSVMWGAFFWQSILVALFFTLFFYFLAAYFSTGFLLSSVWPRIVTPMFIFGSVYVPYVAIAESSSEYRSLFLLSPLTYCMEGLRTTLFGVSAGQVGPYVWSGVLLLINVVFAVMFLHAIHLRIKPVERGDS